MGGVLNKGREAAVRIETPSGKGSGDENFPVGSHLLPAKLRPHVAIFYTFARAADDIADHAELSGPEKICRLDMFEAALTAPTGSDGPTDPGLAKVARMRASLADTGVTPRHCVDLLAAFKQDARKSRYANWDELMGYCELSANPVGRYLLDLHGEDTSGYPASDGLCSALQVLNHLQDIKDDYLNIDRVYLPADWMRDTGVELGDLKGARATPGLRRLVDLCLDATDRLIDHAGPLPLVLSNWRLAMESAAILKLAQRLSAMLRARDSLAERVEFAKPKLIGLALVGAAEIIVRRTVARSGAPGGGRKT